MKKDALNIGLFEKWWKSVFFTLHNNTCAKLGVVK